MNRILSALGLAAALALALPVRAEASGARDAVAQKVRQVDVYAAGRSQLEGERARLQKRSAQLNEAIARAKQKDRGVVAQASLQDMLREALEVSQKLEATDRKLALLDRMMRDTVSAAESALVQVPVAERSALRADVERARGKLPTQAGFAGTTQVDVNAGMDREALLERADLALDYEDKLMREAQRTESRLRELQAQASMATEAQNLALDRRLFDEEDRTFQATRVVGRSSGGAPAQAAAGNAAASAATGGGAAQAGAPSRTEGQEDSNIPSAGAFNGETTATGSAGNAPPPSDSATGAGSNVTPSMTGMGRSQTVLDQRTLVLLREARPAPGSLSPEDEVAQLQARREALLKAAARLRVLRDELRAAAGGSPGQ